MEDAQILALFGARSEQAITETQGKYGGYCRRIAANILADRGACEEILNDVWLRLWSRIPPDAPVSLRAYAGSITRNLALSRVRAAHAQKRGAGAVEQALDELQTCMPACSAEDTLAAKQLTEAIDRFLSELPKHARVVFVKRYWYLASVRQIARDTGRSESAVKMSLFRTREKLRAVLEQEGYAI